MSDSEWDLKLKSFLKKTSSEFKRFGEEVRDEAGKLMTEVQDPVRQQQLKDGLKDFGSWARKTAEDLATVMEDGVKKAEGALGKASAKVTEFVTTPTTGEAADPSPTPVNPPAAVDAQPAPPPQPPPAKSVGPSPTRKDAPPAARKAEKTIGPKPTPDDPTDES